MRTPEQRRVVLCGAALASAAALAYANSLGGPFILDDRGSILDNPTIRHLWPPWAALFPPHVEGLTVEGRPVLNLSLALDYAAGQTAVATYHVTNLLIHVLAGLTLFGLVRRTTLRRARAAAAPGDATWLAFAVALLWLLHPLQTESVTYVIQRAESLAGLFYLLTFYGFIRYAETARRRWAALAIGAVWLGMGTKEVVVTAPVLLALYDRTFWAGSWRAVWRQRRRFYLAVASSWIVLACLVLGTGGNRSGSKGFGIGVPWLAWERTQAQALLEYLRLALWPRPLVFSYGPFWVGPAEALPYAMGVALLVGGTLWALRRRPAAGFLGAWYFGILAVTSFVPGNSDMIADRRMYLPLAAVIALVVTLGFRHGGRRTLPLWLALAAACGAATWARNADYASQAAIWGDTAAKRPGNPYAQYMLGVLAANGGRPAEAIARYRRSLALKPDFFEGQQALANALAKAGQPAEAQALFASAIRLRPRDPQLRYDRGTLLAESGDNAGAALEFAQALRARPDWAEAHDNLGVALARSGQLEPAVAQFQAALRLDPHLVRARVNLGGALADENRLPEATAELTAALAAEPAFVGARINLANVLSRQGRFAEALPHYQQALRLLPDEPVLHQNLAAALAAVGRTAEARVELARAEQLAAARAAGSPQ